MDKAISGQDFDSPDFKSLTWKADDTCTLKILATNGTFKLDASVRYRSWTKSGVHKDEYAQLASAGYVASDPKNRQEVFSNGDHVSDNSLEPRKWSLKNDTFFDKDISTGISLG